MRCTRVQGQCKYEPTQRQLKKQEKARAAPPPRVSKKRAPVAGTLSTRPLRELRPRPEEPAPVSGGSAPGLGGTPQHSRLEELEAAERLLIDLLSTFEMPVAGAQAGVSGPNYGWNFGRPVAGAEEEEYDPNHNRNFGGPVAGGEGVYGPNHDGNPGGPVAGAEEVPDWNFGDFDAGADGASQHLEGLDREFGALNVGSHGGHQYHQQAGSMFGGSTSQANVPLPYYDEHGLPFQNSAGPSNWTSLNPGRPSTVRHWPDGTLPMDPGMDNVPQAEPAFPMRRSQQDRWENAEAGRAARASSAEQDAMDL